MVLVLTIRRRRGLDSLLVEPSPPRVDHWQLYLELRVKLRFMNRADTVDRKGIVVDADGTPFRVRDWQPGEQERFRYRYQTYSQRFWDDRFWLQTPNHIIDLDWPPDSPRVRPNVICRLRLITEEHEVETNFDREISVWLTTRNLFGPQREFRSDDATYDVRDVGLQPGDRQVVVWHEVGHLLDVPHEGLAVHYRPCLDAHDGNDDACYAPIERRRNELTWGDGIMGEGSLLFPRHAVGWQNRMTRHVWPTKPSDWEPHLQHHNGHDRPRLLSELPPLNYADAALRLGERPRVSDQDLLGRSRGGSGILHNPY